MCVQHYIELSSQYERPRPPASATSSSVSSELWLSGGRRRAASVPVARQQSAESGVYMSRASSDTSPTRSARRPSDDVTTHLSPAHRWPFTDAGYLLPTHATGDTAQTTAAATSVAATSDSDLCGSFESDVFIEQDALLPE